MTEATGRGALEWFEGLRRELCDRAERSGEFLVAEREHRRGRQALLLVLYLGEVFALLAAALLAFGERFAPSLVSVAVLALFAAAAWLHARAERRHRRAENRRVRLTLGALVRADSDLLEEHGIRPRDGVMLLTDDARLLSKPGALVRLARELREAVAGERPVAEELAELVAWLRAEGPLPKPRTALPRSFARRGEVELAEVRVDPQTLPYGYLHSRLWPVVDLPEQSALPPRPLERELWWSPEAEALLEHAERGATP